MHIVDPLRISVLKTNWCRLEQINEYAYRNIATRIDSNQGRTRKTTKQFINGTIFDVLRHRPNRLFVKTCFRHNSSELLWKSTQHSKIFPGVHWNPLLTHSGCNRLPNEADDVPTNLTQRILRYHSSLLWVRSLLLQRLFTHYCSVTLWPAVTANIISSILSWSFPGSNVMEFNKKAKDIDYFKLDGHVWEEA